MRDRLQEAVTGLGRQRLAGKHDGRQFIVGEADRLRHARAPLAETCAAHRLRPLLETLGPRSRGLFLCLAAGFTPASQLKLSAGLLSEALSAAVPGPAFYHAGRRCARDDAHRWSKGRQNVVWPRQTNVWREATSPAREFRRLTSDWQRDAIPLPAANLARPVAGSALPVFHRPSGS